MRQDNALDDFIGVLEKTISLLGKAVSLLVLVMIGLILAEIIARTFFNHSMTWISELVVWLMAAMVFLGAPWAVAQGKFVRVDAIFERFSPKVQMIIDTTLTTVFFGALAWVLITTGSKFAMRAYLVGEVSATGGWGAPLWVPKAMLPAGTILLCVAWLLHILRGWRNVSLGLEIFDNKTGNTNLG